MSPTRSCSIVACFRAINQHVYLYSKTKNSYFSSLEISKLQNKWESKFFHVSEMTSLTFNSITKVQKCSYENIINLFVQLARCSLDKNDTHIFPRRDDSLITRLTKIVITGNCHSKSSHSHIHTIRIFRLMFMAKICMYNIWNVVASFMCFNYCYGIFTTFLCKRLKC